jgi:predicted HTH domain antitoxin
MLWPHHRLIDELEMSATLTIELPVDGLPSAAERPANFPDELRFLLAVKLFEQGRISSGKAGRLCNMGRVEFLLAASRSGVPVVDLSSAEMAAEFE